MGWDYERIQGILVIGLYTHTFEFWYSFKILVSILFTYIWFFFDGDVFWCVWLMMISRMNITNTSKLWFNNSRKKKKSKVTFQVLLETLISFTFFEKPNSTNLQSHQIFKGQENLSFAKEHRHKNIKGI